MDEQRSAGIAQTRDLTIASLINGLTLPHLWGAIAALIAMIGGSFYLGAESGDYFANQKMIEELQFKETFFETYLRYSISTDSELRPADTSDAEIASKRAKATSDFVEFIKQIDKDQHSNQVEQRKARVYLDKGQDQSIAVLQFAGGPRWPIPQQIKRLVHGLGP